jgi:hypothetical protein
MKLVLSIIALATTALALPSEAVDQAGQRCQKKGAYRCAGRNLWEVGRCPVAKISQIAN